MVARGRVCREKVFGGIQAFRVQALACVFGQRQPKGWTLNACMPRQSLFSRQTLKELRRDYSLADGDATPTSRGCIFKNIRMRFPRVAKAQPWAEISERFQR